MFSNKNKQASRSSSSSSNTQSVDTLIGAKVVIRGDITFSGGLYVEGKVLGKVIALPNEQAALTLSEQGSIEGEVRAPIVIVNGQLTGDVYASERVELAANAKVHGNVHYQMVEMAAGAQLNGHLIHADSKIALPAPSKKDVPAAMKDKDEGEDKSLLSGKNPRS